MDSTQDLLSTPEDFARELQKIRAALKPDGRLVLLEYRKEDPKVPIKLEHKMSVDEVRTEVEAEGFKLLWESCCLGFPSAAAVSIGFSVFASNSIGE